MADLSLLIGAVDLTAALKVAKEEGMDPVAPDFLAPEFSSSPFADGNALTSVSAANREQVWPLIFSGATKDAVKTKLRQVAQACAALQTVTFRDQGMDDYTHFDVVFARFDIDYNYRRHAKNWVGGWLRVWAKPYGTTGTSRIVGTLSNASGVMRVPVASLGGDVAPEVTLTIQPGTQMVSPGGRILGAAVVPSGRPVFYPVGSLIGVGSIGVGKVTASGTPDGQAVVNTQAAAYSEAGMGGIMRLNASQFSGRNRVLALMKAAKPGQGFAARMIGVESGAAIGATAMVGRDRVSARNGFELADLGIAYVPADRPTSDFRLIFGQAHPRYRGNDNTHEFLNFDVGTATTNAGLIGGFIVLPEDDGYLLAVENAMRPRYRAWFGGSGMATILASAFYDDFGVTHKTFVNANGSNMVGSAPLMAAAGPSGFMLAVAGTLAAGPLTGFPFVPDIPNAQARRISALLGFCQASTGDAAIQFTIANSSLAFNRAIVQGLPSPGFSLRCTDGNTAVQASLSLQATGLFGQCGSAPLHMEFVVNGSSAYVNLALGGLATLIGTASSALTGGGATSYPVACIGLDSQYVLGNAGEFSVNFTQATAVANAASALCGIYSLSVDDLLQPMYSGSDIYTISDHDRLSPLIRNAGSRAVGVDDAPLRGDGLGLTPGDAQDLVVFSVPQDSGAANDYLNVQIKARERFSFLR